MVSLNSFMSRNHEISPWTSNGKALGDNARVWTRKKKSGLISGNQAHSPVSRQSMKGLSLLSQDE